jgi:cell wall-associated NlpC family hydrolase
VIGRICIICLVSWGVFSASRAEDSGGLRSLARSLANLESRGGNTFTEDADERPSPTPKRHRKSESGHPSTRHKTHKHSAAGSFSPNQDSNGSDEGEKAKSGSGSITKSKHARTRTDDDHSEAPGPSPTPSHTPAPAGEAGEVSEQSSGPVAPTATIKPQALEEFSRDPPEVQQLIRSSLALTEQNLSYKYGSADPAAGGMDCSGFIYYILSNAGYKDVPRDSAEQYAWVRKRGEFHAVLSRSPDSFEFDELKAGDLLFWSGTYEVQREIPITHVMIYLGKMKSTGKPVMVGSTDGRSYDGIRRYGVSVFDFKMPSGKPNLGDPDLTARFVGYASIPGLRRTIPAVGTKLDDEAGGEH